MTITIRCDSCNVMYECDETDDSPCAECGSDRVYEVTRAERLQEIDRAEIARLASEDAWYEQRKSVIELPAYADGFLRRKQAGGR